MRISLRSVRAENLRGYTATTLELDRAKTLVVGPNNSGKTSILRLLDWLINSVPIDKLIPYLLLDPGSMTFLLPARHTRHKARRLSVVVQVPDGRSHRRFECIDGLAKLRLNIRLTPSPRAYLRLGDASRSEPATTDTEALNLLTRIRKDIRFLYIPSFRDAASSRFSQTLFKAFQQRVQGRALHQEQGGAPLEYRKIKRALEQARSVVQTLAKPLWPDMHRQLPAGIAQQANIEVNCEVEDFVEWLINHLVMKVSTGVHDAASVPMTDLGSGLQSLLDLAVQRGQVASDNPGTILAIEEPESFLHPSAQRVVIRGLLNSPDVNHVIVTTHSTVVVEEAKYGDVVICRDQRFYRPKNLTGTEREEINSALLSGQGAEMLFARSVLLVEGAGDRNFFEMLRRRLARVDTLGRMDQLFVVPCGGKNHFAPWIKLLQSYGTAADRPIQWLALGDGDASSNLRQALADAQIPVARDVLNIIGSVGSQMDEGVDEWVAAVRELNRVTTQNNTPFILLPVDLEWASLNQCSPTTRQRIGEKVGLVNPSLSELLSALGSKAGSSSTPQKAPWIRSFIGDIIPRSELTDDVRTVLRRWASPVMSGSQFAKLFTEFT